MRVKIFYVLIISFFFGCKTEQKSEEKKIAETAIKTSVESYNYKELKPLLHKNEDKIYVVNFWATWCAPCVKELPYFEKIKQNYAAKNVEVLLVSLDFPKQIEKRLLPFIKNNNIQSNVVVLDDSNEQFWIADISKDWSGAIPATLIYSKDKRKFYEQSFDYKELETELQTFIN